MNQRSLARGALIAGPVAFFMAACAFGMLEVHSSTDTWIGLAAGKQIFDLGHVPKTDTFSFTFANEPWYNQNWGTHALQYWLYSRIGPDAVIYATWSMSVAIFACAAVATFWRTRSPIAALIAGAVVAIGCRDYLSPRPATTGFACMALLWLGLSALEGQQQRKLAWPICLLFVVLLAWGQVHGSFTFGYGVLGLYLGWWLLCRALRPSWNVITARQAGGIAAALVLAAALTVVFGPFGIDNFTHGEKVAGSQTFRSVSEWTPPTKIDPDRPMFPPVTRFWMILGLALAVVPVALGARAVAGILAPPTSSTRDKAAPEHAIRLTLFDFVPLLIGLGMTLWARRFAPIFFLFGVPICTVLALKLTHAAAPALRRWVVPITCAASWIAAMGIAYATARNAYLELVAPHQLAPHMNLFERVVRYDQMPAAAVEYLARNSLTPNVLTEWTQAGLVMFRAQQAKVFMDGRAQQVYDENTYRQYSVLLSERGSNAETLQALDSLPAEPKPRIDAVLVRRSRVTRLIEALTSSPRWRLVFLSDSGVLYVRKDSALWREIEQRLRGGAEWRPDDAGAIASRGELYANLDPPDYAAALLEYQRAVEAEPALARNTVHAIVNAMEQTGRLADAPEYLRSLRARIDAAESGIAEAERGAIVIQLDSLRQAVERKLAGTRP